MHAQLEELWIDAMEKLLVLLKKWKENLSDLVNGYFRVLRLLLCYQKKGEPKDGRNDLY